MCYGASQPTSKLVRFPPLPGTTDAATSCPRNPGMRGQATQEESARDVFLFRFRGFLTRRVPRSRTAQDGNVEDSSVGTSRPSLLLVGIVLASAASHADADVQLKNSIPVHACGRACHWHASSPKLPQTAPVVPQVPLDRTEGKT